MRKLFWSMLAVFVVIGLFAQVGCRLGGDFDSGDVAAVDTSYTVTGKVQLANVNDTLLANVLGAMTATPNYASLTANLFSGFSSTTPIATATVNASGSYTFTGINLAAGSKAYVKITSKSGLLTLYVYMDNIKANTTALNVTEDTTVVGYIIQKAIANGGTNVTVANVSTTSADFGAAKTAFVTLLSTNDAKTFTNTSIDTAAQTAINTAGQGPALSLNSTTVAFGNVNVNSTSASQTVTITNTGATPLTISSYTVTGLYNVSGLTIPATIAASQTLSFTVSFSPNAVGALNGSISLISNAPTSPTAITLTGTGLAVASVGLSATSFDLGNVAIGAAATQALTITNTGNVTVNISNITVNGPFAVSLTAPVAIATNTSAIASITFVPTAKGPVTGSVVFTTDMTGSTTVTVPLKGQGLINGANLTISSYAQAFGTVRAGESATATLVLTNYGNTTLNINTVTPSAEFGTNLTAGTLASLASKSIEVYFKPTTTGAKTGTLTILSDNVGSTTDTIALSGTAIATAASSVTLSTSVTGQTLNSLQIWITPIENVSTVATITLATSAGNKDIPTSTALSFTANPATGVTAKTLVIKSPAVFPDPSITAFSTLNFSTPLPTLCTVQVFDANAGAVVATGTIQ